MMYLRLADGAYNGFDLVSTNPNANATSTHAQLHSIIQGQDSSLVVCPQSTYYNRGRCFASPYVSSAITTLLVKIDDVAYWRIGTQFSDVVDGPLRLRPDLLHLGS